MNRQKKIDNLTARILALKAEAQRCHDLIVRYLEVKRVADKVVAELLAEVRELC
jgi:hypothetical protein